MRGKGYYKIDLTEEIQRDVGSGINLSVSKSIVYVVFTLLALFTFLVYFDDKPSAQVEAEVSEFLSNTVSAPRGLFYDRDGNRLVANTYNYKVVIDDQLSDDEISLITSKISEILNVTDSDDIYVNNNERIRLISQLSDESQKYVTFFRSESRHYYYPYEFAHVLGYTSAVMSEDLDHGYDINDRIGRYALERSFEDRLRGLKVKDFSSPSSILDNDVLPGNDIVLTIDADWQKSLYDALEDSANKNNARGAAAIIVNANTGEIISSVNYPSFNPNAFVDGISSSNYQSLVDDARKPLLDKVVGLQAAPGSTFKLFAAYSLLKNSVISPYQAYLSEGCMNIGESRFCEIDQTYLGYVDMRSAIARSSNIYFCKTLLALDRSLGVDTWTKDVESFGFGSSTGSVFNSEAKGNVASREYKQRTFGVRWFDGDTCNSAIGQGMTLVTPIQLAYGFSAIANGGRLYEPRVVDRILDSNGSLVEEFDSEIVREIEISQDIYDVLMNSMKLTISDSRGSARSLSDLPSSLNLRVKTGSTEATEIINGIRVEGTHSWVTAIFDYKGETYTMIVHQQFGGRSFQALPVVENFLRCLYNDTLTKCI